MLNYLDIMDAVRSAYELNKTIEYLIIKTAIDDESAKYIADRINEIFARQNEIQLFEIVFGKRYYYDNICEVYIDEFHGAYNANILSSDVKEIYPDKLVLEYLFPRFLSNENILVSSLLNKFIIMLDNLLASLMIIPHNRSLHMFELESMPYLSSNTIFTCQWNFYNRHSI